MLDKKWLNQQVKEIKDSFYKEQIETNNKNKAIYHSKNEEISKQYETKTIMFKTFGLNKKDYHKIERYTFLMLEYKNKVSNIIADDIINFNLKKRKEIDRKIKILDYQYKQLLGSLNMQTAVNDVKTKYETYIKQNLTEYNRKHKQTEAYKNRTALNYLIKFYQDDLLNFLSTIDKEELREERETALKLLSCDKTKDRIVKLVNKIRKNIFFNIRIVYKSPAFTNKGSISTYESLIRSNPYNKDKKLKREAKGKDKKFIKSNKIFNMSLNGINNLYELPMRIHVGEEKYFTQDKLDSISMSFAGGSGSTKQYLYNVKLDEFKKEVIIYFAIKEKVQPIPDKSQKPIGVDVNCKHNIYSTSDGRFYDMEKSIKDKIINEHKKLKELKNNKFKKYENNIKNSKTLSKSQKTEKLKEIKSLRRFNKNERRRALKNDRRKEFQKNYLASKLCKETKVLGYDSIVMEDLSFKNKKNYTKIKEYDLNYNDLFGIFRLRCLNDVVKRIGNRPKYNLTVSIVNPAYTSQQCSCCGYTDRSNRKTQEEFKCQNCGFEHNADFNASLNILDRFYDNKLTVLEDKMKETKKPKIMKYEKIKKILNSRTIIINEKLKKPKNEKKIKKSASKRTKKSKNK